MTLWRVTATPSAMAYFLAYNDAIDSLEKIVADEAIDCDFARHREDDPGG